MKYNVGDKVLIKGLDWYNENKTVHGDIWFDNAVFVRGQSLYCGCELTICLVADDSYHVIENDYYWTDEMIEGLVEEEETKPKYEDEVNGEYYSTPKYLVRPSGYQFVDENGNVINATKIVLEKKKKEYPKTYEECYKIMGVKLSDCYIQGYKSPLLEDLQELLICRDAYWKIAGEEMGLGKPWKPDCNSGYFIPSIIYRSGLIQKVEVQYRNAILSFPTPEMRDAFYENFKKEIEICKELL